MIDAIFYSLYKMSETILYKFKTNKSKLVH